MKCYLDTSVLAKLYYPEEGSENISKWVLKHRIPLLLSSIHELELKNAFALKTFRKEITENQRKRIEEAINTDLEKQTLNRIHPDWGEVFATAIALSGKYSSRFGARSLDLLHIAVAKTWNCTHFLSNDERQKNIAEKAGLELIDL